jgi:hypothetical protein
VLANAALGEGIETHLFFTFWGFDIINKKTMGDLKFVALGNPATHMPNAVMGPARDDRAVDEDDEEADRRPRRPRGPEFLDLIHRPAATCGPAGCRPT